MSTITKLLVVGLCDSLDVTDSKRLPTDVSADQGRVATTMGISGEMIRDLMVECVDARFSASRAAHPVQWLTYNGSPYIAAKTIDIGVAATALAAVAN